MQYNDRIITQNTPKCIKICSDNQLSYICSSNCEKLLMENDSLLNIYKIFFTNQNLLSRKFRKLMTSWNCV